MILFLLFEGNGCLNHNLVFISSRVLEPAALLHVRRVLVPEVPDLPGGVLWAGALEHLGVGADPLVGYPLAPWGKKRKHIIVFRKIREIWFNSSVAKQKKQKKYLIFLETLFGENQSCPSLKLVLKRHDFF